MSSLIVTFNLLVTPVWYHTRIRDKNSKLTNMMPEGKMEVPEERFKDYFHFLSSQKNSDNLKSQGIIGAGLGYPHMYSVYILRNNNTPSDFIINLVKKFFHKNNDEAIKIALEISKEDRVLCEIYTRDVAETKVMHILEYAQSKQQEIKCIMQKSDSHVIKKS